MNIGLIGNGYWGKNLLRNLSIHQQIKKIFVLDLNIKNIKKSPNVQYFDDKKKIFFYQRDRYLYSCHTN